MDLKNYYEFYSRFQNLIIFFAFSNRIRKKYPKQGFSHIRDIYSSNLAFSRGNPVEISRKTCLFAYRLLFSFAHDLSEAGESFPLDSHFLAFCNYCY